MTTPLTAPDPAANETVAPDETADDNETAAPAIDESLVTRAEMDVDAVRELETLFHRQIADGLHPGAALAVYRNTRLVVDLWGGLADDAAGTPVAADTMFILYSSTKPLAAACLHLLWERKRLDWDDKVADYWPGFAKHGKDAVTIRHILTHRAGFPETPPELSWDRWQDWDYVVECMENIIPEYPAGQLMAYHPRNFGWVIGELVRRIDGRPINAFLRDEILDPLGIDDGYIGLPPELEPRVSRIHAMEDCDRPGMIRPYNRPEVHQAVHPAGGGIFTARALARFYAMLGNGGALEGVRILMPQTVIEGTKLQSEANDFSLGQTMRRSLGLVIDDSRMAASPDHGPGNFGHGGGTFGHGGAGTSVGWADPDEGLAVAYITNGFRASATNNPRLAAISQAVRAALL